MTIFVTEVGRRSCPDKIDCRNFSFDSQHQGKDAGYLTYKLIQPSYISEDDFVNKL